MSGTSSFDKHVDRYEAWFIEHPLVYVSELHAVRELLPTGSGVEIGVGTGRFAAPLGIVRGVEPSRRMAELARKRGVEVALGVAENLPYSDGEFDYALMVTTVCFLDDTETAFREVRRVLRPGGAFLIGFVDRASRLGKEYVERKDKSQHRQAHVHEDQVRFFGGGEIERLLAISGDHHLMALALQASGEHVAVHFVVFDQ